MSVYEDLIYEVKDGIAVVTLNRPQSLNAFTVAMGQSLKRAIEEAVADAEMQKSFASSDFREGIAHYVEKRAPAFTGS